MSENEIEDIYGLPKFNLDDRKLYFSLSSVEENLMLSLGSIRSKIYFILQLGYFKAKKTFFSFSFSEVLKDAEYILQNYFPDMKKVPLKEILKEARLSQQNKILPLFSYHKCTSSVKKDLLVKASQSVIVDTNPFFIFKELLNSLECRSIILPSYSSLQDIVGKAISEEKICLNN